MQNINTELIFKFAKKLSNPENVKKIVKDRNNKNPKPIINIDHWNDLSIAGGYPGVLSLFITLDQNFPNDNWDLIVHDYIIAIKKSIESKGITSLSLFGGLTGVCFFIKKASKEGKRYTKILDKLNIYLIKKLQSTYFDPLEYYLKNAKPIPPHLYEAIQGLSGIGIFYLSSFDVIKKIIKLLIRITYPIRIKNKRVPGWYISNELLVFKEEKLQFPNGIFNLGLSHGIPGVLAFLSIAMIYGLDMPGQKEAIQTIAKWLKNKRKTTSNRFFWDARISFEEEISQIKPKSFKSKDAWCYGTAGVARALYLAGYALKDRDLQKFALESFISIFNSQIDEWNLLGPSFCHGISGLLMITHLMARDTKSYFLQSQVDRLTNILLSYYDTSFPFGFKHFELMKTKGFATINRADLLEGASGILLSLFSLNAKHYSWHLPFLIDYIPKSIC